jgi:hypothetical protein
MTGLGIEPSLPEYVPGALQLSYLALGYQAGLHLLSTHGPLYYTDHVSCEILHIQHSPSIWHIREAIEMDKGDVPIWKEKPS